MASKMEEVCGRGGGGEGSEGDILSVDHASSLDGCTWCLQGLLARQAVEFSKIVQKVRCGF